ncbi:hypothetical protein B0E34_12135 [Chryseobacterium mucoviscidosis]|uniref:Uncharacterized protein n=1 Tax=Chryseobacterium mucoviscidosis TaxID=1945581 RepID=A0A202BXR0_9FLAO|nr:hypothetical protein B0E34_12135 [Chryseobacterium mucoviscidosis]
MLSRDCYGVFFENAKFAEAGLKFMRIFFRAQGRETQLMIIMVYKFLKFFFHFKFWLKPLYFAKLFKWAKAHSY